MPTSKVSKHTAEPWVVRRVFVNNAPNEFHIQQAKILDQWGKGSLAVCCDPRHANRIVACVNACAGLADPSAVLDVVSWLGDAVNCLEQYRDYGESMREHGRGFQATGRIGHDIDSVISACHAAIAKVKP